MSTRKTAARPLAMLAMLAMSAICMTPAGANPSMGRLFATPTERSALDAHRGAPLVAEQQMGGSAGLPPPPVNPAMNGAGADGAPAAPPPPPPSLTLNGVVRSSSGRTTVWLNDVAQSAPDSKVSKPAKAKAKGSKPAAANGALAFTLPSGKRILLQPGQRYDLNEGRVKDVNEP